MKKISVSLTAVVISAIALFMACSDEPENPFNPIVSSSSSEDISPNCTIDPSLCPSSSSSESSSQDPLSSSVEIIPGSSSSAGIIPGSSSSAGVIPPSGCAYKPEWCNGVAQASVSLEVPIAGRPEGKCFFATDIKTFCAWGDGPNASMINGVEVGQGSINCWGNHGKLPEKADGGYYVFVGGLNDWDGTTGSAPSCSGGNPPESDLTCTGLAGTAIAGTVITLPIVRCDDAVVTAGISWTGAPASWTSPAAGSYTVSVRANCGGAVKVAECGTVTVTPPPSNNELSCTGLAGSGTAGTAISQPTVRCGNQAAAGVTWTGAPNWTSPAAGSYTVSARANCGGTSKTATCGNLVVAPATPTERLTCTGLPAAGTAGSAVLQPTVRCGNQAAAGVTWTGAPNWTSPAAGSYTVSARANCGGVTGVTAACGSITINPRPAVTLTCGNVPATTQAGSPVTAPSVRCGTSPVTNNITWAGSPRTPVWNNLTAGTYTNVKATASCDGRNQTADCPGTMNVTAPASSSSGNTGYPVLKQGDPGVRTARTTRYWDACKPHCSWTGNAGGNLSKSCNISGATLNDAGAASACNGGTSFTCMSQAPWRVSDNLAYGFAAVAPNQFSCGKCFQLQFTNNGVASTGSIIGKTMIVKASNIGYDVDSDHFDIMIPGGGVGQFDALSNQIRQSGVNNAALGSQYGGFRTTAGNNPAKVKEMCAAAFRNLPDLKKGCDWYVDWFMNADNPQVLYKEVTCPAELNARY
ncbi:MAG: hypothetical protein LBR60_02060 [Fibrobacter sp.]|jgi:hypothetical protein|nr:hypothetical protein [Fibrobacter sp.]